MVWIVLPRKRHAMIFQAIAIGAILSLGTLQAAGGPSGKARAKAKITVQNSEAKPWDQAETPALTEISIRETFTGDFAGESVVRALQVQRQDKSARLVSLQRFRGKLAGRQGTFVLQGAEVVVEGTIKATWF